jgi:hypothetical protein
VSRAAGQQDPEQDAAHHPADVASALLGRCQVRGERDEDLRHHRGQLDERHGGEEDCQVRAVAASASATTVSMERRTASVRPVTRSPSETMRNRPRA